MAEEQKNNPDYDSIARFYDAATGWTLESTRREIAGMARAIHADKVLDMGCGTGQQLHDLARLGIRVLGVDNSPAMLKVARRQIERLPKEQRELVELRQASGQDLDGENFDLCILSLLLHESGDDPFKLLDSAFAASTRVFVLDWGLAERNLEYPARALVRIVERLAGRRHYASYSEYMRQGALEGLMQRYQRYRKEAGLESVSILDRKQMAFNTMLFMDLKLG